MPVFAIDEELVFPPVHLAEPDGLLAIGGDLSEERLLLAYRHGIFPWYGEAPVLWWCPDPRFVLFPAELKINKTVRSLLNKNAWTFTINKDFAGVIHACKKIERPGQDGTWITNEIEHAYCSLHEKGFAQSAEVWERNELIGGLYGIRLGNVFFGESMFSRKSNASRYAFAKYVEQLIKEGVTLFDCQVHTAYLESMGARMIPRVEFISLLDKAITGK